MAQRLRIFISSPGDVVDERLRADLIIDKLAQNYSRFFRIESYRWEHEAMLASKHFQDAIEPPSAFDIVLLVLWSRLGTPLPERTAEHEYRGMDGRAPVTGTEWEYEEALKAAREKGAPDLLAFRNISKAPIDTLDAEARARSNAQLDALDVFWRRHFVDQGVFLAAYDEYRTLEEFAQRLEESLCKLIERRVKEAAAGVTGAEPIWLDEPFRGLEPYEFEHAPIFFGRDAAVMKATEQLAANARSGCAFLLVSGPSGSGKSSLVKAGMLPRLMKPQRIRGAAFRRRTVFRPAVGGNDVFLGLATALTRTTEPDAGLPELIAPGQDLVHLATHLRSVVSEPGYLFANALGRMTEAERKSGRLLAFERAKLILVVDQFEELFTVSGIGPNDRLLFVQFLAGLARSGVVWLIATLRTDFWHRAMEIRELIALTEGQGRIDLAAASAAELSDMIRKPAQAAGLAFEEHPQTGLGLEGVLAEDAAAAPGALPLLSFTLYELYKDAKAHGSSVLRHVSYEALGGLEGAIARRANEIMSSLPATAQATLPLVLRALTSVSTIGDRTPVARSAPLESFAKGSPARMLVDAFVAARLLVATGEDGAAATVRLAHEALISRWQRAVKQLDADRRDLETRTLVEQQFGRWSQARGSARWSLLLRNPDLANAIDLAKRWGQELEVPLHEFIKWSGRRARLAQTLSVVAMVVFAVVAFFAFWQWGVAVEQRRIADHQRHIADQQLTRAETNFDLLSDYLEVVTETVGSFGQLDTFNQLLRRTKKIIESASHGDDSRLALERARTLVTMGELKWESGDIPGMYEFAKEATKSLENLFESNRGTKEAEHLLARSNALIGKYYAAARTGGDPKKALEYYKKAIFQLTQLESKFDQTGTTDGGVKTWRSLRTLARVQQNMGDLLQDAGDIDEAEKYYNDSMTTWNKLKLIRPDDPEVGFEIAWMNNKFGDVLLGKGKDELSLERFNAAGEGIKQLGEDELSTHLRWRHALSIVQNNIGEVLEKQQDYSKAIMSFEDAKD